MPPQPPQQSKGSNVVGGIRARVEELVSAGCDDARTLQGKHRRGPGRNEHRRLGLLPQSPDLASGLKLVVVWLLVQLAAGSASQLIAQFASKGGPSA